jgi:hypothetical protein
LVTRIRSNPNKATASSGEAIKKIARQEGPAFASGQIGPMRAITSSSLRSRFRRANVETITAKAGGLKRTILHLRLPMRVRFKPLPSDIFSWQGLTEPLTRSSGRIPAEQKWYAFTGRVVSAKCDADGDIHIALEDATGDKPGVVVAETPAKPQWCQLRQVVFGWTQVQFPFRVRSGRKLKLS